MTSRTVTTQSELDAALSNASVDWIDINSPRGVWLHLAAYDSATVRAYGAATVRAYGSATVRASSHVAIHLHSALVSLKGGVVIDHTKVDLTDAKAWCDYHGVEVKRGIATLYKAVNDAWSTDRGFDYSPGSKPTAPDWRDTDECGYGLHFGPTPHRADYYRDSGSKYVAVGVRVSELRPITTAGGAAKAKAPRVVRACVEVDRFGAEVP